MTIKQFMVKYSMDLDSLIELDANINKDIYYSNQDDRPMLFYRASWIVFETYFCDFKQRQW